MTFHRFDPLAKPSGNDRNLRTADRRHSFKFASLLRLAEVAQPAAGSFRVRESPICDIYAD